MNCANKSFILRAAVKQCEEHQVQSICQKEFDSGAVDEYAQDVVAMLIAYRQGKFKDITQEIL